MPESRNRPKHTVHHPPATSHPTHKKVQRSAAFVVAVIASLAGLAVAYFTKGADVVWMLVGAVSGAFIGYLIGHSMDKSIDKSIDKNQEK